MEDAEEGAGERCWLVVCRCFVGCRRKTAGPSKGGGVAVGTAGVAVGRAAKWSVQRVSAGQGVARGLRGLMQLRGRS